MPVLRFVDARQMVDGKPFLGPLNLEISVTGITCVLGPNGAGKSLLLAMAHGMAAPDTGQVTWDGVAANASRATRSYVQQQPVVLRRTVRANVAFPLGLAADPAVESALAAARLVDKATSPAATLSGGELRRMALARALVTQPSALILDEPFAGLDPANSAEIEAAIVSLSAETPVILSTHDLVQARRVAARIVLVHAGQIAEVSTAEAFFAAPQTDAARDFLAGMTL